MHPYVLITLLSGLGAAALASAIVAREFRNPTHRLAGLFLLAISGWSLCTVLADLSRDAASAAQLMRLSAVGSMFAAPAAFHLLLRLEPGLTSRYRLLIRINYALVLGWILVTVSTTFITRDAVRTSWGWMPVFGPGIPFSFATVGAAPMLAFAHAIRALGRQAERSAWLHVFVIVPFTCSSITDFVLPWYGIPFPRLASTVVVAWGLSAWWWVYRFRTPVLSPQRFAREILQTLPDGVVLVRLDGTVRAVNDGLVRLIGRPARELQGRSIEELLGRHIGQAPSPAGEEAECELRAAGGDDIPVSVSHVPLGDESGATIGYVLVIRDLREVVSLRSRLVISGRLAAVGQLAAGIAHEINNPIAYVRSNLALLERHWGEVRAQLDKHAADTGAEPCSDDGVEVIGECQEGVDRVVSIVRDVGGFAQEGSAEREWADPNELLETAVRVATPQLRHRAQVERRYGDVPMVLCLPQELMQVFLNLLLNAAQSIEESGTIALSTSVEGDAVTVRVEDDGRGLGREVIDRVFDPFFTTKPAGEGTGLGLSISRQIVSKHGGEIGAHPRQPRGAVFWVRLPTGRGEGRREEGVASTSGAGAGEAA